MRNLQDPRVYCQDSEEDVRDSSNDSAEPELSSYRLTGEWLREAIGLGPDDWGAAQRELGGCLFEQKWLDLTCGELCDQASLAR